MYSIVINDYRKIECSGEKLLETIDFILLTEDVKKLLIERM